MQSDNVSALHIPSIIKILPLSCNKLYSICLYPRKRAKKKGVVNSPIKMGEVPPTPAADFYANNAIEDIQKFDDETNIHKKIIRKFYMLRFSNDALEKIFQEDFFFKWRRWTVAAASIVICALILGAIADYVRLKDMNFNIFIIDLITRCVGSRSFDIK